MKKTRSHIGLKIPQLRFTNIFKKVYHLVSLDHLNIFDAGSIVNRETLINAGVLKKNGLVKILANGDITKAINVKVDKVSESAKEKIIAAGGTVEE